MNYANLLFQVGLIKYHQKVNKIIKLFHKKIVDNLADEQEIIPVNLWILNKKNQ